LILGASNLNHASATSRFQRIVVIGDSLSDGGNAGRFSNGPVWVEQLAGRMGLALTPSSRGGSNFAVGGAKLDPASGPTALPAQLDELISRKITPAGTLYVVWGGGNDLLAAVGSSDGDRMLTKAGDALRTILSRLIALGASDILVPNLPNVGLTPAVRTYGPAAEARGKMLSAQFCQLSDEVVQVLRKSGGRSVHLIRLDVWSLADRAVSQPHEAGFDEVRVPCQQRPACDRALFWDGVHPTTYAHGRLADSALHAIETAH
jgi:outer membrane lipase/esterase